jgi:hypothetical protein
VTEKRSENVLLASLTDLFSKFYGENQSVVKHTRAQDSWSSDFPCTLLLATFAWSLWEGCDGNESVGGLELFLLF